MNEQIERLEDVIKQWKDAARAKGLDHKFGLLMRKK